MRTNRKYGDSYTGKANNPTKKHTKKGPLSRRKKS